MIQLNQHVTPLTEAEARSLIASSVQPCGEPTTFRDLVRTVLLRYNLPYVINWDFLLQIDAICQQAARAQAADIPVVVTRPTPAEADEMLDRSAEGGWRWYDTTGGDCMTLRDLFAMHAPEWVVAAVGTVRGYDGETAEAYLWADAMLQASGRTGETTDTREDASKC
jgi:hypothetical protein